ncbi:hypothetical protein ACFWBI_21775 [Streptomyces sp. NPDC059982]|uniref:hypothetical protein n=1 Tax=unclassified Streptomyces TaxID=2593676 RepID=UPI00368A6667
MTGSEKTKARLELFAGKVVRKAAPVVGEKVVAAKGRAMEVRGKARLMKASVKDRFH